MRAMICAGNIFAAAVEETSWLRSETLRVWKLIQSRVSAPAAPAPGSASALNSASASTLASTSELKGIATAASALLKESSSAVTCNEIREDAVRHNRRDVVVSVYEWFVASFFFIEVKSKDLTGLETQTEIVTET